MLVLEGRAFYRGRLERLAVGIEDGKIAKIAKQLRGDEYKDYGDRLILPGGVDLHAHFRDPGLTHKEDFATGTAAAAVGGVTTVLDMPNTVPPVATRDAYEAKRRIASGKANVDFGLYGLIRAPGDVRRFAGLAPAGKLYMAESGGVLGQSDPDVWREIVAACAETSFRLVVHAEDPRAFAGAGKHLAGHDRARPPEAEASAIRALADAAKACESPPKIHVTHLTSRAGLQAVADTGFSSDVTPHHLFLDHTMPLKTLGKANPPLRSPEDRGELWRALLAGGIDAVASDHAPHTVEEKDAPFPDAPSGVPGVETMLPVLLRQVKAGDLPVVRFVEITAMRPAGILAVDTGSVDEGAAANLIVVDPRKVVTIRAKDLHSRCGWTPFEGSEAVFPETTFVHGELAAEGREVVGEGLGRLIPAPKRS